MFLHNPMRKEAFAFETFSSKVHNEKDGSYSIVVIYFVLTSTEIKHLCDNKKGHHILKKYDVLFGGDEGFRNSFFTPLTATFYRFLLVK